MSLLPSLTPEDLYAKARHLHVDLATEPFLLPLVKQAAVTPLPPQWTVVRHATNDNEQDAETDAEGQPCLFRNELTGEVQATHPADAFFAKQIRELRRQYTQPEDHGSANKSSLSPSSSGWVEFVDPQDARRTYYYDFVTRTRQQHAPIARKEAAAPARDNDDDDAVASCSSAVITTAAVASPDVFEHAATLHRQATMKKCVSVSIYLCGFYDGTHPLSLSLLFSLLAWRRSRFCASRRGGPRADSRAA
ncbi:hypothetical protein PINS_up010109 [Pythium insidiosum]|nr:hypothetical protein PINS_up010109 [Pythium insidiosum]